MKYRGLDDDLSRGPVPTLDFQKKLIRTLAAYKINLYSPYFEHTCSTPPTRSRAPRRRHQPGRGPRPGRLRRPITSPSCPSRRPSATSTTSSSGSSTQPLAETPHGAVLAPGQPDSIALITQVFTELAADLPRPIPPHRRRRDRRPRPGPDQSRRRRARPRRPSTSTSCSRSSPRSSPSTASCSSGATSPCTTPTSSSRCRRLQGRHHRRRLGVQPAAEGYAKFLTPFTNAGIETWVSPASTTVRVVYPD